MKIATNVKIFAGVSVLASAFAVAFDACEKLDVVGTQSVSSFEAVLNAVPSPVVFDDMNGGWSLAAPDGTARFVWSPDFSASPVHDAMLVFDAAPFIAAGLDPKKLPETIAFFDDAGKQMIMLGIKLGSEKIVYKGESTPLAAYEQIVKLKRKNIGYHGALDHYGMNLGGGNLFEWAKDMSANDKDIVFVLNPAPFIEAGVDPAKIEGWAFAQVTVDDDSGRPVVVDKILKPFNLR